MKKILILLSILTSFAATAQSIEINPNGGTNASAILDLKSTTKGFLLPRMTNAQMRAIPSPAQGLLAFCTDCSTNGDYYFYKGTDWVALGSTTVSVSTTVGPVSANADEKGATITNGVLNLAPANATKPGIITATDQTFGGVKTFSSGIVGNVTGNATTVTTNANLTGVVTSTGNATSIADRAISNAMLANGAVANLSGTNTGDQTNITGNAATVTTNANLTGDVTSIGNAATVVKINGTALSGLATGLLKNTTGTGVPTIATPGTDYQLPITLTTTGSGVATLSSNTLNIPNVSYTLPTATSSVLGGVKPDGTTILNDNGVISVAPAAGNYLTSSTGVTTFNGSTTGLTPASATSGAVTLGGVLVGANGGTGVANTGKTITLGGNLTTLGAFNTALTTTANTAVTLPVTGTLATLTGTETLTNKTLTSPVLTTPNLGTPSALVGTNITGTAMALNIGGNAATVTTNANLTGVVTSNGNVTSIANDAITNAMIANDAVSRLSGTNTGDQTTITGNAGTATKIASITNTDIVQLTSTQTLTNKTLTSPTITGTGAIAGTFTGDLTGNVNGNATTASTATTATNVSGTVAIANGGTGATSLTANNVLLGNGTSTLQAVAPGDNGNVLTSNGTTWTSAAATIPLPTNSTKGSIMYNNGSSWATLAPGIEGQVLKMSSSGLPVWGTNNIFTCGQSMVTDIDNNNYSTVLIGNQCWMRENLRVTRYNDGTPIQYVSNNVPIWNNQTIGAYATDENNPQGFIPSYLYIFGYLYNWYASKGIATEGSTTYKNICPTGWQVPTEAQMNDLVIQAGGTTSLDEAMEVAGGKLKSTSNLWDNPNTGADNSSGFTALPAGYYDSGIGLLVKEHSFFWSSSSFQSVGIGFGLDYDKAEIFNRNTYKTIGGSVRCLVLVR